MINDKGGGFLAASSNAIEEVRTYYATITGVGGAAMVDHATSITDIGDVSKAVVRLLGATATSQQNEAGTTRIVDPHIRFKDTDEVYINIYDAWAAQNFKFCFTVTKYRAPIKVEHYTSTFAFGVGGWADVAASITDTGAKYADNKVELVPGVLTSDARNSAGTSIANNIKWRLKDSDEVYMRGYCVGVGTVRAYPFSIITY